jgi:hypothetical protein
MSSLKLQVSSVLKVFPSDTIDVPSKSPLVISSTTVGTAQANKLVDTGALFLTTNEVKVGAIIYNTTDSTTATVTAVDSATVLSISADIMVETDTYVIYSDETKGGMLYVGVSGDVKVTTSGGDTVTIVGAPIGWHPIEVVRVWATGTTATDMLMGW